MRRNLKAVSDETNFINNILMATCIDNKSTMKGSTLLMKKGYLSKGSIYSNTG